MYEALSTIRSEKAVLEERLEAQMQNAEEIRAAAREELIEIRQKHEGTVSEHDERIILINRMHANQCEQLCREVVEANQEVIRLQNVLADMTRGAYPVDRTFVSTISREDTARSLPSTTTSSRSRRADTYVTLLLLFAAVFLGYTLQSFQSIREVIEPVDAYNRTIVLNVDITSHQNEFCQDNDLGRSFDEIPWDFETSLDTSLESVDMTTQIKSLEQVLSSTDLRGIFFDSSLPFKWLGARVAALKKKSTQVHE